MNERQDYKAGRVGMEGILVGKGRVTGGEGGGI
jgi:hypothetical protein